MVVVVVVSLDEGGVGRNGRVGGYVERSAVESSAGGITPARKRHARPGFREGTDAQCCCTHSSRRQPGNADGVDNACGMRRSPAALEVWRPDHGCQRKQRLGSAGPPDRALAWHGMAEGAKLGASRGWHDGGQGEWLGFGCDGRDVRIDMSIRTR
ncbi:putative kanadaptin [Iris pallida]|uniref:Kanadaptin n=1 Tax=Iris pallida TaxID=29817 RepID=A0AAX6F7X3_IRIPA|nr:putative kanadaptin [Iris pallida]